MLSEFGAADFAVLQIGRDLRVHADAVASGVLTLAGLAGGQTVVNVTAIGTMGDEPLPVPQAVNQTVATAALRVAGDMQATQAFLASAGGALRLAPLMDSGYGMTATATAAWAITSNVEALLDTVYDGVWQVVAQAFSGVIAHSTAASVLLAQGAGVAQQIANSTGQANLSSKGDIVGNQVQQVNALAQISLLASPVSQAVAVGIADGSWRLSFSPVTQAVQLANGYAQLQVLTEAIAEPYVYLPTVAASTLQIYAQSAGTALSHSRASAAMRIMTRGIGSWAEMSVATGSLRIEAIAERGTNRLNYMALGYRTANRPFQNRTSNRPSGEREAVSP
ncbi:hypothetical protein [Comamonas sp.]|uniref:hypothetical protein n=1 Tax=Comamonas sp. TaxID=34028 RepID=UPI0028A125CA|nr:hypothetical protein [Comamonas sp.]